MRQASGATMAGKIAQGFPRPANRMVLWSCTDQKNAQKNMPAKPPMPSVGARPGRQSEARGLRRKHFADSYDLTR